MKNLYEVVAISIYYRDAKNFSVQTETERNFTLRRESTISAIPHFNLKEQHLTVCLFSVQHRRYTVFLWCNMKGFCDESVWLKSHTEHVNGTNLSTLSCLASDCNHTLSSETPLTVFLNGILAVAKWVKMFWQLAHPVAEVRVAH